MTTATARFLSPFDAQREVTFAADCKSAVANRWGIGFGQRGYAGNEHFSTREAVEAAFEAMLVDLRNVYGTPARNWTGRYVEEELSIAEGVDLVRRVRFVPLLKSGKRGKAIHTLYIYPIRVTPERIELLSAALKMPVS
jgi:hypothetical protein